MKWAFLAFRNVFRQSRRTVTLGINYLFISLILLLVFSLSEGVRQNIGQTVTAAVAGHLSLAGETVIDGKPYTGITGAPTITARIKKEYPGARIEQRYSLYATVYHQDLSKRLSFQGLEESTAVTGQLEIVAGSLRDFQSQKNSILVPQAVAEYFNLKVGDELLVAARTHYGAFNTASFQVKALYRSANYFIQETLFTHFDYLRNFDLAPADAATNLFVWFPDRTDLNQKRNRVMDLLDSLGYKTAKPDGDSGGLAVVTAASPQYKTTDPGVNEKRLKIATIDEVLVILGQVLSAVNALGLGVAALLLFIIAVSLFINLRMTIHERMKEIGTLRALGAQASQVTRLFLLEALFLGLIFTVLGLGIGFLLAGFLAFGPPLEPRGLLMLFLDRGHFVIVPTIQAVGGILGSLAVFTLVFAYFPARYGGRIRAVEAMNRTT